MAPMPADVMTARPDVGVRAATLTRRASLNALQSLLDYRAELPFLNDMRKEFLGNA